MVLAFLVAPLVVVTAAVDAPVSAVTVFSDRAQVTRSVALRISGTQRLEMPVLPERADLSTVRVEVAGAGASVERVDVEQVLPEEIPADEARKLLAEIEALDARIALVEQQLQAWRIQTNTFAQLVPTLSEEPLRPAPKLDSAGWASSMSFISERMTRAQARSRELEATQQSLYQERARVVQKAQLLGGARREGGWRVVPTVRGTGGTAMVSMTYFVGPARWFPTYDLQLTPERGEVQVAFAGLVSQESGEDWSNAKLTLSTAVPAAAKEMPKPSSWKLGERERFIPTPTPIHPGIRPPPPAPPLPHEIGDEDLLRQRLMQVAGFGPVPQRMPAPAPPSSPPSSMYSAPQAKRPMAMAAPEADFDESVSMAPSAAPSMDFSTTSESMGRRAAAEPRASYSLAPPFTWRPPSLPGNSPAALAGGYDLAYASVQRETVQSGKGARRVALFAQKWPVKVERRIFPALAPEAYLVAELKSPSPSPLPGGTAQLYVGADPAGQANLSLVSPGESFTLPLGIDRALKPIRNVQLVTAERGFIGPDEISKYVVTTELANPYPTPVFVRIRDQWPVTSDEDVEIKLLETKPWAIQDPVKGSLEWQLTLPANGKTEVTFSYTIRRPRGWRLHQREVVVP